MDDKIGDVTVATAKASPPLAAIATGLTADQVVLWMTGVYIALQVAYLIWKWRREAAQA